MVFDKVSCILAEILGQDEKDITKQTEFTEEYGIDSIDFAKLILEVEKKFNITIYDDKAADFKNVCDIVDYINEVSVLN